MRFVKALSFLILVTLAACAGAITDCQTLSSGTYTLENDVSNTGTCFTVSGNNVVLNCAGHTITGGSASIGVSISSVNNAVVRNCSFYDFDFGVKIEGTASGATVFNNTFDGQLNGRAAVSLGWDAIVTGNNHNVSSNSISNIKAGNTGIWLWGANGTSVVGNTLYGVPYAIYPFESARLSIRSNQINGSQYSIYLNGVEDTTISYNTINNSEFSIEGDYASSAFGGHDQPTKTVNVTFNKINNCTPTGLNGRGSPNVDFAIGFARTGNVFGPQINVSSNTISKCWNGIYLYGDDGYESPEYTNFTVTWNDIALDAADDGELEPVKGIRVDYGGGDLIAHNTISAYEPGASGVGPLEGIYSYGGSYASTIFNNTLNYMDEGIYVQYGGNEGPVNVSTNTIVGTFEGIGILVVSSYDTIVSNNDVSGSRDYGMKVQSSLRCRITDNTIDGVSGTGTNGLGVYLSSGSANSIINDNTIKNASYAGLSINSASNITATGNYINGTQYGVTLGINATFVQNVLEETGTAIDVMGSGCNITGNTVSSSDVGVSIEPTIASTTIFENDISTSEVGINVSATAGSNNAISENAIGGTSQTVYSPVPVNFTYGNATNHIAFTPAVVVNETLGGRIVSTTGVAAINASALPTLNKSARITMAFNGVCGSPVGEPVIYYAPNYYTTLSDIVTHGQVCDEGTTPACTDIVCTGSTISFDVEHFDSYGGQGYPVPEFSGLAALAAILLSAGGYAMARKRK